MPRGLPTRKGDGTWDLSRTTEARLGEAEGLLPLVDRTAMTDWWLAVSERANTPNWDIASTCSIDGQRGILLVEAKAHDKELRKEEVGKSAPNNFENSRKNHEQIRTAIEAARTGLEAATGAHWGISRDTHYQMSNRFAWAWKLTELKYPVVLVYLGLLNATEMKDRGNPFGSHEEWADLVRFHSSRICPANIWDQQIRVNGRVLLPLIRSVEQPLETSSVETAP